MSRLAPKTEVIRRLFALYGNVCAFPNCPHPLISKTGKFIAQICHIEAAEEGGERYNIAQSDEERRGFDNLMLMCYEHHVETNDVLAYNVSTLKRIKSDHEAKFLNNTYTIPEEFADVIINQIQETINQIHNIVSQSNKEVKENKEYLLQIQATLKEMQRGNTLKVDESGIYSEQLEFIKELRKQHKAKTALEAALKFKSNKWEQLSDEMKFKIVANIASILFELGRQKEAANYLLELKEVNYEKGETQSYITLAYAILDDNVNFDESFKKALEINNQSINLWVAYIYIQDDDIAPEAIREAIPSNMLEKPEILFSLGEAFIDRERENEGFVMLEKALALTGEDRPIWQIKGIYAAKRLVNIITLEKLLFQKFSAADIQHIKEAVQAISESWNHIRDTELAVNGWHMLMNRGIALKALGENGKALDDLREAYRLSSKFDALKNLILHYIEIGPLDEANILIKSEETKDFGEDENFELQALKARVSTLQNNTDEAVEILRKQLLLYTDERKLRVLDLITLIYFECGAYEKALPYALQMIDEFCDWPNGYLTAGICYSRMGNILIATENFDKVVPLKDKSPQKILNVFQVAEEYMNLKEYDKAAAAFELILDEKAYNPIFRKLILANFYGNKFERCVELCIKAKAVAEEDSNLNEILFRTYEELGEDDKAEQILEEQLLSTDIASFDHFRLLGIKFYKKLTKREKALKLALEFEAPEKLSLSQRMAIARVLLEYGKISEGLEMAYQARLDNYEDSNSHVAYIQVTALRPAGQEEEVEQLYQIDLDTAFALRDEDMSENTFFLTDDKRLIGPEIVRTNNSLGKKILGKTIGEQIEMPNNLGIGNKLTIIAIYNKYAYAFKVSQTLLETKFADESGMIFFKGGQGGFDSMKDFMLNHAIKANKQREQLYNLYKNDAATVGMLAQYQNKTQVEVWLEFLGMEEVSILCYTHDEQNSIIKATDNRLHVVLDMLGLLTVFMLLNRPELLDNCGFKWAIAKSTIDELREYQEQIQIDGPRLSVGVQHGELRKSEFTQQNIDAQSKCIDSMIEWCNKNATIKTPRRISKSSEGIESISDIIGTSSTDTLLLANELGGVIFSDEEKLKSLSFQMNGTLGFSTYQLIAYNARSKFITPEQFVDFYRPLIRANYTFIPVTSIDLWDFLDENGFKIRYSFISGVKGLTIMRSELAAIVVVGFAKRVYLNISVLALRTSILLYVLNGIKNHRDYLEIVVIIEVLSMREFNLMTIQRDEFISLLRGI